MKSVIDDIRRELQQKSDQKTKDSGRHFFREEIKMYGVKTAIVIKIGKEYFKTIKEKRKGEIFNLCEALWQSGYMEESFIACNWSYYIRQDYEPEDFQIFEKWLNTYVSNWAQCDSLCNHTIGAFVDMYPEYLSSLRDWAKSDNRWVRRGAAVTLIIPARQGKILNDILELADILLPDQDDLVQKGYGWMLKEASRKNQKEIFEYIVKNKKQMPRTALRYAIEKMPKELWKKAMER